MDGEEEGLGEGEGEGESEAEVGEEVRDDKIARKGWRLYELRQIHMYEKPENREVSKQSEKVSESTLNLLRSRFS